MTTTSVLMRVKKYKNRKLYDREKSEYVTLDRIHEHVRIGGQLECYNDSTKCDYTAETLLACIEYSQQWKELPPLSSATMTRILRAGGMIAHAEAMGG
jgi:polyhydroxyalkanoate synthesis regulator protein